MWRTALAFGLLAAGAAPQPPSPRSSGRELIGRIYVDTEDAARVEVRVRVDGAELRPSRADTVPRGAVVYTTPFALEVEGLRGGVHLQSSPSRPVRVRVVSGVGRPVAAVYRGWSLRLERRGDQLVPVAQGLPAPPR